MSSQTEQTTLVTLLLRSIRAYQRHKRRKGPWAVMNRKLARFSRNVLSILTASDIDVDTQLGRNLRLPHPTGVVTHGKVVIGDDCLIMQQVTIGLIADEGVPHIGSRVYIGSGAKVLGPIKIGDGAAIGANAVVLCDVPPRATAVGVPARIVEKKGVDSATSAILNAADR